MSTKNFHIYAEDMGDEMCQFAIRVTQEALQVTTTGKGRVYSNIADSVRKAFEKEHGRGWNVIVGRSFGAFVTHRIKSYLYFSGPGLYVLIFRS